MGRFRHHVLCGLVALLGLVHHASAQVTSLCGITSLTSYWNSLNAQGQPGAITYADEGEARQACEQAKNAHSQYHYRIQGGLFYAGQGQCIAHPNQPNRFLWRSAEFGQVGTRFSSTCAESSYKEPARFFDGPVFRWTNSCATRPSTSFSWEGADYTSICLNGCRYTGTSVCGWYGDPGSRVYRCSMAGSPTGATCTGSDTPTDPPPDDPPPDPDPPGDPPGDPPPDDPPPDDPPPDDPPPDDPPQEPGQGGNGENLGPKLDAIEQAVLGLGPRIDRVRDSVEGARADANADADRIVGALHQIRDRIGSDVGGGGSGGGDGQVDLSPLTPGPDGGEHPVLSSIVEYGDGASLVSQLDTDGWGYTRSCPALAWPQSFDLGWGNLDMMQAIDIVCFAMGILGWVIGLAGLIQAAYVLSQMGR